MDDHEKNKSLQKELEESVAEAEDAAKMAIAIDMTRSHQMSLNSAGDYILSKKGHDLEDLHQIHRQEQEELIHEIEVLKKSAMINEACEAAKDEASLIELSKIEN